MAPTRSSSISAPSLCSAFAIADSSTFLSIDAALRLPKLSCSTARSTGKPRTWSATSLAFREDRRAYRNVAETSMVLAPSALFLRFPISGVAAKRAGRRKFAQLVTYHVFGNQNRYMLPAVVNRDREADHLRDHHRTPRPCSNWPPAVRRPGRLNLSDQMVVYERALLDRAWHDSEPPLLAPVPSAYDHRRSSLVSSRFVSLRRNTPGRHGMAAT